MGRSELETHNYSRMASMKDNLEHLIKFALKGLIEGDQIGQMKLNFGKKEKI
jgi:hypothetical protein